jgi:hypothetical protein
MTQSTVFQTTRAACRRLLKVVNGRAEEVARSEIKVRAADVMRGDMIVVQFHGDWAETSPPEAGPEDPPPSRAPACEESPAVPGQRR